MSKYNFDYDKAEEKEKEKEKEKNDKTKKSALDDYSEQSTPLIPTQSTPVNFIKNFLDFPLDSY